MVFGISVWYILLAWALLITLFIIWWSNMRGSQRAKVELIEQYRPADPHSDPVFIRDRKASANLVVCCTLAFCAAMLASTWSGIEHARENTAMRRAEIAAAYFHPGIPDQVTDAQVRQLEH